MKFTPLILNIKDSTSNLIFNNFEGKTQVTNFMLFFSWNGSTCLVYTLHVKIIFQ